MRAALLAALLAVVMLPAAAQNQVGVAYYDADRLYDTIPSPFYDDSAYTPSGRYGWTGERYMRKVRAVAAVLDSMAMPLAVLAGVENEQTVRDIAVACRSEYSYIHRTLPTRDGLDMALLYFGDAFVTESIEAGRRVLTVMGRLAGCRTVIVAGYDAAEIEQAVAGARSSHPGAAVIAAGRCSGAKLGRYGVRDAVAAEERAGRGTVVERGEWRFGARMWVDTMFDSRAGIYARRELLDEAGRAPAATFSGGKYRGGTGRELPFFVYLRPKGTPFKPQPAERGIGNGE